MFPGCFSLPSPRPPVVQSGSVSGERGRGALYRGHGAGGAEGKYRKDEKPSWRAS